MSNKDEGDFVPLKPLAEEAGHVNRPFFLSARRLRKWVLVLEARDIPYQVHQSSEGWQILIPFGFQERASQEITLYEKENRNWPPVLKPMPLADNTLTTLSILGLLAIFHNLTYLNLDSWGLPVVDWLERGCADAGKILAGEWWRTVTALTLHTDLLHLFSNIAIGSIFVVMVCKVLGSGLGWSLILLTGVVGNLWNAWLQPPDHLAVGASTALFGAVGLLATFNLVHNRTMLMKKWPLPLAAALALLAMLGATGDRVDVSAHLWGFASGVIFGAGAGFWIKTKGRPGRLVNALLAAAAAALVFFAWRTALS
jgi:membrane associated rhomboid family serine protease